MIRHKLAKAVAAIGLAAGLAIAGTTPAQAINGNNVMYCNWPNRATIKFTTLTKGGVNVYSPNGYFLGSKGINTPGTYTYYTPWEDVRFSFYGQIAKHSAWCR